MTMDFDKMSKDMDAALAEIAAAAREEALEEAAKEADRDVDDQGFVMIRPYHEIAAAIRALKTKDPTP